MLALGSLQNPDMTLRDVEIIAQDPDNGLIGLSFNRGGFHLHDIVHLVYLCDPFTLGLRFDLHKDLHPAAIVTKMKHGINRIRTVPRNLPLKLPI